MEVIYREKDQGFNEEYSHKDNAGKAVVIDLQDTTNNIYNHDGKFSNILFGDGHVKGFPDNDEKFWSNLTGGSMDLVWDNADDAE